MSRRRDGGTSADRPRSGQIAPRRWLVATVGVVGGLIVAPALTGALATDGPGSADAQREGPLEALSLLQLGYREWTSGAYAPSLLESLLVLLLAAYLLRRALLARLAYRPGPVELMPFEATTPDAEKLLIGLMVQFRSHLAVGRGLQAQGAPVPGNSLPDEFIQLLRPPAADRTDAIARMIGLLLLVRPTHAYRIQGALHRQGDRYGVSTQMTVIPGGGGAVETSWGASWDEAIELAAHAAASRIVPYTKTARTPPWRHWRHSRIPAGLFHHYHRGKRLAEVRRYDEALGEFFGALGHDAGSLDLRMEVGFLQEKLGLFADALATYAVALDAQGAAGGGPLARLRWWRLHGGHSLAARYRLAIALAFVEWAVPQWGPRPDTAEGERDDQGERETERGFLRSTLGPRLAKRYARTLEQDYADARDGEAFPYWLAALLYPTPADDEVREPTFAERRRAARQLTPGERNLVIARLFLLASRTHLKTLDDALGPLRRRWSASPLARDSVRIARVWVEVRLALYPYPGEPRLPAEDEPGDVETSLALPYTGRLDAVSIVRATPKTVASWVDAILSPPLRRRSRRWLAHYNAACLYAIYLLPENDEARGLPSRPGVTRSPAHREEFARLAIEKLEDAIGCADGAFVARQRDWILSEDPDLVGLREHPRFRAFEAIYFPAGDVARPRGARVHRLEASQHVRALVREAARMVEERWHARERVYPSSSDIHRVKDWWRQERQAWAAVESLAGGYRRWQTRRAFRADISTSVGGEQRRDLIVSYPRFEDAVTQGSPGVDGEAFVEATKRGFERLRERAAEIGEVTRAWCVYIDRIDRGSWSAVGPLLPAKLARHRAALWQAMGDWLDEGAAVDQHDFLTMAVTGPPPTDQPPGAKGDGRERLASRAGR